MMTSPARQTRSGAALWSVHPVVVRTPSRCSTRAQCRADRMADRIDAITMPIVTSPSRTPTMSISTAKAPVGLAGLSAHNNPLAPATTTMAGSQ